MIELGLKMFAAYLLGSVSGSLLLGRFRNVDIREQGSGNAGATNALRTLGLPFAIGVALIDVGKGMLAAAWIPHIGWLAYGPGADLKWLTAGCGLAAVVGHIYPFWHQFRGGKGAATAIGAYAMLAPKILIPALIVFFVSVVASGYVGLSTMLTVIAAVILCAVLYAGNTVLLYFAIVIGALVIFAHRSNIKRMMQGNENRLERAMLWRRQ